MPSGAHSPNYFHEFGGVRCPTPGAAASHKFGVGSLAALARRHQGGQSQQNVQPRHTWQKWGLVRMKRRSGVPPCCIPDTGLVLVELDPGSMIPKSIGEGGDAFRGADGVGVV